MDLGNFFRICVYFCIVMTVFTLAINFVSALGVFPVVDSGVDLEGTTDDMSIFSRITNLGGGMADVWAILTIGTGVIAIVLAKLIGTTTIIGVWFFSEVFWTSYIRIFAVVGINDFVPMDFIYFNFSYIYDTLVNILITAPTHINKRATVNK